MRPCVCDPSGKELDLNNIPHFEKFEGMKVVMCGDVPIYTWDGMQLEMACLKDINPAIKPHKLAAVLAAYRNGLSEVEPVKSRQGDNACVSSCVNDDALMIYNLCAARRYHLYSDLKNASGLAALVRDIMKSLANGTVVPGSAKTLMYGDKNANTSVHGDVAMKGKWCIQTLF